MNTTENNKLIAEFMNWQKYDNIDAYITPFSPVFIKTEIMKFHSDWNWLMEVVEKINLLDDFKYSVTIQTMDCFIEDNKGNKIISIDCIHNVDELKKSVYNACLEFIKWYNLQNK